MRTLTQLVLAAALMSGTALADEWNKTFTVAGRPDLRVETDDGSVTIRPGDDRRIVARVTTMGWRIASGEVEIHESQTGGHVELTVHVPRRRFGISFGNNRSIRVELEVPRQLQTDVRTGDGAINLQGITGESRLRTGDGHIEADSFEGSLNAESGDGHVRIRGRFDMLTLHTGDGSIEAEVLPGSHMSSGWRVVTGDGSVTLRLPPAFAADLELHTGDGHISMDLPAERDAARRHDHDMRARLNGGGAIFSVHTGDGSINVRPL